MVGPYCPKRGDVVWINLDPQTGHEQAGTRPALVLSPETYNRKTGRCVACPITSQRKGYPFEVPLPEGLGVTGVVLSDQIKNLNWQARKAQFKCKVPAIVVETTIAKFQTLLDG